MFKQLLDNADLTRKELAAKLGINPASISAWHDDPPQYAIAFLKVYADNRKYVEFVKALKAVLM